MVTVWLVFIVPIVFGVVALVSTRVYKDKVSVVAVGALVGLALFTLLTYLVSLWLGQSGTTVSIILLVMAGVTGGLLIPRRVRSTWRRLPVDRTSVLVASVVFVLSALLAHQVLVVDEQGGLGTGILNAWGDMAWHMANITLFAEGQSFPPGSPILAGTKLQYPFLVSVLSAALLNVGATFVQSVALPATVLMTAGFIIFYALARELTKSRLAAVLALVLLIGGGGTLGWTRLAPDLAASGQSVGQFLLNLPRDYTGSGGDAQGFHFLNIILSLFLPQRSFLFGIPLACALVLTVVVGHRQRVAYVLAGVMAGMLPLFHAHTVLALILPVIGLFVLYPGTQWVYFLVPAALLGLPEVAYYALGEEDASFVRWGPGWMAAGHNLGWYWLKNTGLMLPATLLALLWPGQRLPKMLALCGLIIFATANIWLFAPWPWDNFKLLIYWLIFSLPLVSSLAARGWRYRSWLVRLVTLVFVALHIVTGALDITKTLLPGAPVWEEWNTDAIALAADIRTLTRPGEVVVTAPYHNTPVALAGRPMYLGFPGHVWSHGGNPFVRQQAVAELYQGQRTTLPDETARYLVVGPVERQQIQYLIIQPEWQLLAERGEYQLYELPQ